MSNGAFQPGANLSGAIGVPYKPENIEVPVLMTRQPASTDVLYPIGKQWIDIGLTEWVLLSQTSIGGILSSNWALSADGTGTLDVRTLTGDSGGAIMPTGYNINLLGTANQIVSTGTNASSQIVWSLSPTLIVPGTFTSNNGLNTLGALTQVGTANINASGAATTNIGTGGTGVVNLGNATGNTAVTGNITFAVATQGVISTPATASGASPQTANGRVFEVTFTGVSIAAAATESFTISNSTITGSSTLIHYTMIGCTTGAALCIESVTNSASQSVIVVSNGTGATTSTANLTFIGTVLN